MADGSQREQIVEGQREISRRDAKTGECDRSPLGLTQRLNHIVRIEILKHVVENVKCKADDRDAYHDAELVQDLLFAQDRDDPAKRFQHPNLE